MNYDLIELAKRCPDLTITVRLSDLVEANKGLIEGTKRELEHSLEACREVKEQKRKLNDITFELKQVKSLLDYLSKEQSKQSNVSEELMDAVKENTERIITHSKLIMAMLIVIAFSFVFTIPLR